MLHKLKRRLYYVIAAYFAFWAKIVLNRWKPRIIVITGSSGKTTTMHLVEAQLGENAVYSHHANAAFGIAFHILGLPTNVPSKQSWITFILRAPFGIFRKLPKQSIYVVEADCDRPNEGAFIAKLLHPEVTMWVSVYRTHSMNFDQLVKRGAFADHDQAIAYEFGNFPVATSKLVLANGDQKLLTDQLERVPPTTEVKLFSIKEVKGYELKADNSQFTINSKTYTLAGLHPKEIGINLQLVNALLSYLGSPLDPSYARLVMPPGRSSIFKGKKDCILIDSTYNTGLGATIAMLGLFSKYPNQHKWLVMGDILELGSLEHDEHEQLAHEIAKLKPERAILLGRRTKQYTFTLLSELIGKSNAVSFESPKEVLDYLNKELKGGEALLFKGAQGLEGVVEQLLKDPSDASKLVRREASWVRRRKSWGLPG